MRMSLTRELVADMLVIVESWAWCDSYPLQAHTPHAADAEE